MLKQIAQTGSKSDDNYVSYEAYLEMAPEDGIMEWSNGRIITYMPPLDKHQEIVGFLHTIVNNFASALDLGITRVAPYEVKLPQSSREPDILYISHQNSGQLSIHRFTGAPDLVVEVVSRSSVRQDRVVKFSEYEQAGVQEYWLIDPRPSQRTVEVYALENGIFEPVDPDEEGRYASTVLNGFWFNPKWFWKTELPLAQAVSAEIIVNSPTIPADIRAAYQPLHNLFQSRG